MTNEQIDLEKAIELLKESVYFINLVKNTTYHGILFEDSYTLASNIDKFLKETSENES